MKNLVLLVLITISSLGYCQFKEIEITDGDKQIRAIDFVGYHKENIFFSALDLPAWKRELWKMDVNDNYVRVPIPLEEADLNGVNDIRMVYKDMDEILISVGYNPNGSELIKYKNNGSTIVKDENNESISYPSSFMALNGLHYFVIENEADDVIFKTYDGNTFATPSLNYPEGGFKSIHHLKIYENELYFNGITDVGNQIWKFNGISLEAISEIGLSATRPFFSYKNELFFQRRNLTGEYGIDEEYELIRFDGERFSSIGISEHSVPLAIYEDHLYFELRNPEDNKTSYYTYDGENLTEYNPEDLDWAIRYDFANYNNKVLYTEYENGGNDHLISYDGTIEKKVGETNNTIIVQNSLLADNSIYFPVVLNNIIIKYTEESCKILEDDLELTSQEQINNFDFCEIAGNLVIDEIATGDILDLSPLNTLETLGKSLYIRSNSGLTEINGFESLIQIGGDIEIKGNPAVKGVTGFRNLQNIGKELKIVGNTNLVKVNGFESLFQVIGITLHNNFKLSDISAFSDIIQLGNIRITNNKLSNLNGFAGLRKLNQLVLNNSKIVSLNGLSNLEKIEKGVYLYTNQNLEDISQLSNTLTRLNILHILNNAKLTNIDGLIGLSDVEGEVKINNNQSLENLNGLADLTRITRNLVIRNNIDLSNACGIISLLENPENVVRGITIENNGVNTSTANDILNNCLVQRETSQKLVVFPNPNLGDKIIVEGLVSSLFTYTIYTIAGEVLEQKMIANNKSDSYTITFQDRLINGTYLLTIKQGSKTRSASFYVF